MSSPLPLRPSIDHTPRARSVIDLDDLDTVAVPEALGCKTARSILQSLGDSPATASDLADVVDTSLQNAHYHLEKLVDAGLVTDAGTWYSSKGREMRVYDLASERIELRLSPSAEESAAVERAPTEPPEERSPNPPHRITKHAPTANGP